MVEKILEALDKLGKDRKIAIRINDEFTVYTTAETLINNLKKEKKVYFEDGCYDVFLDLTNKNTLGWYKRYGLLSFDNQIPVLFRDGDNWKVYKNELSDIPYYFHKVEDTNNGLGFYNLIIEDLLPEEEFEKTYNCYYFENIYQIKIKDFKTDKVITDLNAQDTEPIKI